MFLSVFKNIFALKNIKLIFFIIFFNNFHVKIYKKN
jgi:hypothetical protein